MRMLAIVRPITGKNGVTLPPGTLRDFPEKIARHLIERGAGRPVPPEPTSPEAPSRPETTMPRYSRGKRIKFLGRHSRDFLEGEIIALLPPAPGGTPWYQVRTRNQIVCVSQNHIVEEIA